MMLPLSPAAMGTSMRADYEDWVAAGKPCLRRRCGHRHCDHIPSEAMECDACDCLGFVGLADGSAVGRAQYWASTVSPTSRESRDHDRDAC
jgi:hypothetical protein